MKNTDFDTWLSGSGWVLYFYFLRFMMLGAQIKIAASAASAVLFERDVILKEIRDHYTIFIFCPFRTSSPWMLLKWHLTTTTPAFSLAGQGCDAHFCDHALAGPVLR